MIFVTTFKGYEDKTAELDAATNKWIQDNQVDVRAIQVALSHEVESRARSGDLLFMVVYKADAPIP